MSSGTGPAPWPGHGAPLAHGGLQPKWRAAHERWVASCDRAPEIRRLAEPQLLGRDHGRCCRRARRQRELTGGRV
ncbi:hypothetical protein NDU88_009539 [Pleurodeles waltl]|uniref:Uncharacterized protein n=1 Tax=Pleurodeles waltl TaxID=8319 RepID=A0AAV7QT30_PLEWA|nr:hypothetical protein NDU88_009539 [Pleurodeles waltl]